MNEQTKTDLTVSIKGWTQLFYIMEHWDNTWQDAINSMVEHNQDMSFITDDDVGMKQTTLDQMISFVEGLTKEKSK